MSSEPTQANMQTTWIIYGALCMSMIIYGAVGFAVVEPPEEANTDMVMPLALGMVSLTTSAGTFFVDKFIQGNYQTRNIIKWALTESIAIYGFVLYFLTANTVYLLAFIGFALALMAVHAPNQRAFEDSLKESS